MVSDGLPILDLGNFPLKCIFESQQISSREDVCLVPGWSIGPQSVSYLERKVRKISSNRKELCQILERKLLSVCGRIQDIYNCAWHHQMHG